MRTTPHTQPESIGSNAPSAAPAVTMTEGAVVARTAGSRALVIAVASMFVLPWAVWGSAIAQANGLIGWRLPQGIALWVDQLCSLPVYLGFSPFLSICNQLCLNYQCTDRIEPSISQSTPSPTVLLSGKGPVHLTYRNLM